MSYTFNNNFSICGIFYVLGEKKSECIQSLSHPISNNKTKLVGLLFPGEFRPILSSYLYNKFRGIFPGPEEEKEYVNFSDLFCLQKFNIYNVNKNKFHSNYNNN